jgi:hypothetical protein
MPLETKKEQHPATCSEVCFTEPQRVSALGHKCSKILQIDLNVVPLKAKPAPKYQIWAYFTVLVRQGTDFPCRLAHTSIRDKT